MKRIIFWIGLIFVTGISTAQQLHIHPVPAPLVYPMHNDDFTVWVRTPGSDW